MGFKISRLGNSNPCKYNETQQIQTTFLRWTVSYLFLMRKAFFELSVNGSKFPSIFSGLRSVFTDSCRKKTSCYFLTFCDLFWGPAFWDYTSWGKGGDCPLVTAEAVVMQVETPTALVPHLWNPETWPLGIESGCSSFWGPNGTGGSFAALLLRLKA